MVGVGLAARRDFVHTGYGLSAISHVAETSRIQGVDLYPEAGTRLREAVGFQATDELNGPPSWLCGGAVERGLGPITEVGYNALHNRLGNPIPNTGTWTTQRRPLGANNRFVSWETLTHGDNLGQNKKKGPSPDGPFSQVDDTGIEPVTPTVSR